jgi:lipopolysaccharide/colanic/teichoic acid biosynthesis glycosyltransferase
MLQSICIYPDLKRFLDIIGSGILTLVLLPIGIGLAFLVRRKMGSPILFLQVRPGQGGRPFTLFKFRTMLDSSGEYGHPLPDAERLTPLGSWMRRWSLDELPELLNVLKGDMSLVGPRPLLLQYLERYSPEQARRHEVKPGLTGWAQVNGRNAITWEEKFSLDVWYVDHQSFWLDVKIILLTLVKVLKREGISAEGEATMPEFMGSSPPGAKGGNG